MPLFFVNKAPRLVSAAHSVLFPVQFDSLVIGLGLGLGEAIGNVRLLVLEFEVAGAGVEGDPAPFLLLTGGACASPVEGSGAALLTPPCPSTGGTTTKIAKVHITVASSINHMSFFILV